jgi:hypothetical protein
MLGMAMPEPGFAHHSQVGGNDTARATGTAGAAVTGIGRDAEGGSVARPFRAER